MATPGAVPSSGMDGFSNDDLGPVAAHVVGYRSWFVSDSGGGNNDPERIDNGGRIAKNVPWSWSPMNRPRGALCGITNRGWVWGDGLNVADCGRVMPAWTNILNDPEAREKWTNYQRDHKATPIPVQSCGCGFWAYTEPTVKTTAVWGVIHGWGRIIIGPRGFRCQYARIVALTITGHGNDDEAITKRRGDVGVCYPSVVQYDVVDDMIRDHPATDLRALIGEPPEDS